MLCKRKGKQSEVVKIITTLLYLESNWMELFIPNHIDSQYFFNSQLLLPDY